MHILFLTGGVLIGLPILLHLIMRQEPKRIALPTFRFLKMKRRINQRKMRLRHLLLLLMRMLLIALITLALFQPRLLSDRFNLRGQSAVALVIVIDTSPSMGMILVEDRRSLPENRQKNLKDLQEARTGAWTLLDDARARAMELLDEVPPGSSVAIIDTSNRGEPIWERSIEDARERLRKLKKPRGNSRTVNRALEQAYNLLYRRNQDTSVNPMPHLICVMSDRTPASWDVSASETLKGLRERVLQSLSERGVKDPMIFGFYLDFGQEKPNNLAISQIDMRPQIIAANVAAEFTVTLNAIGGVQNNTVHCRIDEDEELQPIAVKVEPGVPQEIRFRKDGLKPGLHQAEIRLETPDRLPYDDIHYLTFRVREPRRVLLVADAPSGIGSVAGGLGLVKRLNDVTLVWRVGLEATAWYACDIRTTAEILSWRDATNPQKPDARKFGAYEAIVLVGLSHPRQELWELLATQVEESGTKLVVSPGGEELLDDPDKPPVGYDFKRLLPATLQKPIDLDRSMEGVTWTWDALNFNHPLLAPFRPWLANPRIDFVHDRPQTWGYWQVSDYPRESVIVYYNDAPDAADRRPALLEKVVGKQGGKVLLFTTPLDARYDERAGEFRKKSGSWNDYPTTSFFLVLSNLTVRYLTGEAEDDSFNFLTGTPVVRKWPSDARSRSKIYYLSGPDVDDTIAVQRWDEKQSGFLRLPPEITASPGNFTIVSDPQDKDHARWIEGFSLNVPPEESNLERIDGKSIEEVLGAETIATPTKDLKLREVLKGKFDQPIELFPFLMIALLLFLAFENLLANKFYKQSPVPKEA